MDPNRSKKKFWIRVLAAAGFLAASLTGYAADQPPEPASTLVSTNQAHSPKPRAVWLSPGLAEVLRLVKSQLSDQVIVAYIQTSPFIFRPNAEELVILKKAGVPDAILTAILEHGAPSRMVQRPGPGLRPPASVVGPPAAPVAPYPGYQATAYAPAYPPAPATPLFWGPMFSFNNSFPTLINGTPVYSGYYVPGYGYFW